MKKQNEAPDERTIPHSIDAEMGVLGAMLLGENRIIDDVSELIGKDDFYRDAHGAIFDAMVSLHQKNAPVDIVTLKRELERSSVLEAIGGLTYIMQLGDFVPTTANAVFHAGIVAEKAQARRYIEAALRVQGMACSSEYTAPELAAKAESEITRVAESAKGSGGKEIWVPMRSIVRHMNDELESRYYNDVNIIGMRTGLSGFDCVTGGLKEGTLTIVAGRPAMGKTALIGTTSLSQAEDGEITAFFSMEMNKESLGIRWAANKARVNMMRFQEGRLTDEEWDRYQKASETLWDLPLFVDDTPALTVSEIRSRARRLKRQEGKLGTVYIDYIQRTRPEPGTERMDKRLQLDASIAGCKTLARELNCRVVVLSQLTRAVEKRDDKRPLLSDLAESGGLEAEADMVTFLYRPAYYAPATATETGKDIGMANDPYYMEEAEIIVAKNRQGATGFVKVGFQGQYCRFVDLPEGMH